MKTAQARAYAELLEQTPRVGEHPTAAHENLGVAIAKLERHVGSERWTLQKLSSHDWEVRTRSGDVGRGTTPTDAVSELLAILSGAMEPERPSRRLSVVA